MIEFEVGEEVSWVSQSQGSVTRKSGKVIANIPSGEDVYKHIPHTTKKSHIKFGVNVSKNTDRVLVAVPAGKDGAITHYYCPPDSRLRSQEEN